MRNCHEVVCDLCVCTYGQTMKLCWCFRLVRSVQHQNLQKWKSNAISYIRGRSKGFCHGTGWQSFIYEASLIFPSFLLVVDCESPLSNTPPQSIVSILWIKKTKLYQDKEPSRYLKGSIFLVILQFKFVPFD